MITDSGDFSISFGIVIGVWFCVMCTAMASLAQPPAPKPSPVAPSSTNHGACVGANNNIVNNSSPHCHHALETQAEAALASLKRDVDASFESLRRDFDSKLSSLATDLKREMNQVFKSEFPPS